MPARDPSAAPMALHLSGQRKTHHLESGIPQGRRGSFPASVLSTERPVLPPSSVKSSDDVPQLDEPETQDEAGRSRSAFEGDGRRRSLWASISSIGQEPRRKSEEFGEAGGSGVVSHGSGSGWFVRGETGSVYSGTGDDP
jgi:hypothetical protein